eukprot:777169-Pelagomonas_calceolata.AAC.3
MQRCAQQCTQQCCADDAFVLACASWHAPVQSRRLCQFSASLATLPSLAILTYVSVHRRVIR